jgi:hypothetical protein
MPLGPSVDLAALGCGSLGRSLLSSQESSHPWNPACWALPYSNPQNCVLGSATYFGLGTGVLPCLKVRCMALKLADLRASCLITHGEITDQLLRLPRPDVRSALNAWHWPCAWDVAGRQGPQRPAQPLTDPHGVDCKRRDMQRVENRLQQGAVIPSLLSSIPDTGPNRSDSHARGVSTNRPNGAD